MTIYQNSPSVNFEYLISNMKVRDFNRQWDEMKSILSDVIKCLNLVYKNKCK